MEWLTVNTLSLTVNKLPTCYLYFISFNNYINEVMLFGILCKARKVLQILSELFNNVIIFIFVKMFII